MATIHATVRFDAAGLFEDPAEAVLTDEHAVCSYGQPVLLVGGVPRGPAEVAGTVHPVYTLTPRAGEIVVTKRLPNSFAGTTLDEELKRLGRKELIVVGFMTHMCVSATVRAALDHGYRCTMVASACASRDLPDGRGGVVSAAEVHRVELAALGDRFAAVVATAAELADR